MSTASLPANSQPVSVRNSGMSSSMGMPASSVPAGQTALQNQGRPRPKLSTRVSGRTMTSRTRQRYLPNRRTGGRRYLRVGMACSSSWSSPKGQAQPQMNRPNTVPSSPRQPST